MILILAGERVSVDMVSICKSMLNASRPRGIRYACEKIRMDADRDLVMVFACTAARRTGVCNGHLCIRIKIFRE